MHQSHWGRAGLARTAYGHALSVRIPAGSSAENLSAESFSAAEQWNDDAIARTLEAASSRWWGNDAPHPRLWIERVAAASTDSVARRRLDAELRRPMSIDGPVMRVVLLRYSDGAADLVVTADRRDLDPPSLAAVADVLVGNRSAEPLTAEPLRQRLDGRALEAPPTTGMRGRTGFSWVTGEEPGPHPAPVQVSLGRPPCDIAVRVALAAGRVLGRYEDLDTVRVGLWSPDSERPVDVLGGFDKFDVLSVDCAEHPANEDIPRSWTAPGDDTEPQRIGVLSGARGCPGTAQHWLACHSPPFPLTLAVAISEAGDATLAVYAQPYVVNAQAARQFAQHAVEIFRRLGTAEVSGSTCDDVFVSEDDSLRVAELGAHVAADRSQRIDTVFRQRARERPNSVALVQGRRTLTYGELDEHSRWAAVGLRECGVEPGHRVGLCLDRSIELVVTMLAILEVGAAFVPMDIRHPPDRLEYTAGDAGIRLVVTDRTNTSWGDGIRSLTPQDLDGAASAAHPDGAVASGLGTEMSDGTAVAYVIYTSGSTGRPKGVLIPHCNVLALMAATEDEFALTPDDTWSMFHSSAFDFSVWEIWGALLTGARLVIVPYWISRSPVEFHTLLEEEGVSVLSQTPSAFGQLTVADRELPSLAHLRLVVFGGESLDTRMLVPWMDRYPESRCRLVNMYGTTETTVHVTAHTVTRRDALSNSKVVGKALQGWSVHVLDDCGRPVPAGVTGEICVGGVGVALGYLNRPELTEERFVSRREGEKLYRTGDRGRLHGGGTLEHLGRLDTQVQLRGFRVELGEVRGVLLDDPEVTAAAVVATDTEDDPAGPGIDAYVISRDGKAGSIRQRAATFLPDYMLPRTITVVETLPLTINGKLDVARLPVPERHFPTPPTRPSHATSTNDLAATLTDIWESVLGVPVGADDNLFELGGNSLCAIKADSMMRRLGLPVLPMRELYLRPSVRGICDTLNRLYPPADR
ncbi:non-ribosomal peptide synthetase [Rhodococcus tibetensis]|uniref:Non-ribosomal peptide synthetase n=1 Tax=Rhodococcus tibetensis TaxID=2965064 RepID=A0ABT1QJC4_9NOCA|nr:non-ribosomal peptide synthetase [Rhodococcus sp. FXJ9.536]MCQ4122384.1 non-ribosomal peptide synthetase [Rhodococcus sp. FXJ9.536]